MNCIVLYYDLNILVRGVIQQKFYMGEIGNSLLTINVISSSIPGIMPLFFVYLTNNNMCTYLPFYFFVYMQYNYSSNIQYFYTKKNTFINHYIINN